MAPRKSTAAKADEPKKKAAPAGAALAVTATANGFYGNKIRVPGEQFTLAAAGDFSERWMTWDNPPAEERFVATGGTDGVVGATIVPDELSDEEKAKLGISDNDDRSRDMASDPSNDPPPAADSEDK